MQTKLNKPALAVLLLLICVFLWWFFIFDSRVNELNSLLEKDRELSSYPYFFEVISLENGVATMHSPRSANASAVRSLRFMFPSLVYENDDSEAILNAQKELARIQYKAADIIKAQPDVNTVKWELDTWWLQGHGVTDFN